MTGNEELILAEARVIEQQAELIKSYQLLCNGLLMEAAQHRNVQAEEDRLVELQRAKEELNQ